MSYRLCRQLLKLVLSLSLPKAALLVWEFFPKLGYLVDFLCIYIGDFTGMQLYSLGIFPQTRISCGFSLYIYRRFYRNAVT
jgi:hypothetical protein